MPITASDFRNGVTFEMDGQVMQVVEFQHVKPGKGAAFVRTKMKNVMTVSYTHLDVYKRQTLGHAHGVALDHHLGDFRGRGVHPRLYRRGHPG